ILAARGGEHHNRALALIDENLRGRPNAAADLRARAVVQASQPSMRQQAIRVFEETARSQPLSSEEQLLLARLFAAAGDPVRAREQVIALLTTQPENPQFLAFYIDLLVQAQEIDEAREPLRKLQRLEPHSRRTRELQGRVVSG